MPCESCFPPSTPPSGSSELVETMFPDDEPGALPGRTRFDLQENPDLPEIYSVLLDAFSQWRLGHCSLKLTGELSGRTRIEMADPVAQHLKHTAGRPEQGPAVPALAMTVEQKYHALDYTVEKGGWDSREKLLEWLQSLTLLYFMDKHEYPLPSLLTAEIDRRLLTIAAVLSTQGIIAASPEPGFSASLKLAGVPLDG